MTDEGIVQIEYLFFLRWVSLLWLWIGPVRWILERQDEVIMMVLGLKDHVDDYMYLHRILGTSTRTKYR